MVAPMRAAWDVNCNGTRRLLTACREQGVARFVQLSSVAAFGFDFPANVDESHPLITNGNSYVDTKIASEHTVLAAHAGGEIDLHHHPAGRCLRAGIPCVGDRAAGNHARGSVPAARWWAGRVQSRLHRRPRGRHRAGGREARGRGPDFHAHIGCWRELRGIFRAPLAVAGQAGLAPDPAEGRRHCAGGDRRKHRAPARTLHRTGPWHGRASRASGHVQHRQSPATPGVLAERSTSPKGCADPRRGHARRACWVGSRNRPPGGTWGSLHIF